MRPVALALFVAALLAAPLAPATADDGGSASGVRDRLPELVGTWSCRTATGSASRVVVEQPEPNTIALRRDTYFRYNTSTQHQTFRTAPGGGWTVEVAERFQGRGPAWTGDSWIVDGTFRAPYAPAPRSGQLHFERLDAQTLRMFGTDAGPYHIDALLCRRGDTPPDPSACVAPNLPPYTVAASQPDTPVEAMQQRIGGTVRVLVRLDADSHVTGAAIQSSPSPLLNASAMSAAKRSTYHTAIRDCKPVPSEYLFTVDYMPG